MTKHLLPFLILSSGILPAQTWTQLTNFSSNQRDDAVAFVIGNKAYCGSGLSPWFTAFGDFRALDMTNDTWSTVASLPNGEHRQYAMGFSGNGKGYVFGGVDGSRFYRNVLEFNPALDSWTVKTSLPDSGISGAASFVINDVAYIVCGRTAQKASVNTVWAYNIVNDTWQQKANFPFGNRWRASGASLNGKGYLVFGADSANLLRDGFYEYDPVADSWTTLPSFPGLGRNYSSLTAISGQLVVFGGIDSAGVYHKNLWRYEPGNQTWHQQKGLPAKGRKGGVAFTNGTALYYTTGIDSANTRLNETWKCDNPVVSVTENTLVKFEVFPNPANDELTVIIDDFNNDEGSLTLTNSSGQRVYSGQITSDRTVLNLTALPLGLYVLQFSRNDIRVSVKVFKL